MDRHAAAVIALREYIKISNPRYAFMIEAPWGSGKTHLVKQELSDLIKSGKARYATLNGIVDRKGFRRALLAETSEAKISESIGKIGNTLGIFAKFGNVGSIVQDAVEDRMINNLPKVLIFDDIERCEMSPSEILGLVNEFVEHREKSIVICGYIEQSGHTDDQKKRWQLFQTLKEKVVGRTVRIVAQVGAALPEFIAAMPEGRGKDWFQQNSVTILDFFSSAKLSNLRVLRQCIHDCGRVIDILDDDLVNSVDAMRRFVRTYLALAIAVSSRQLSAEDLQKRDDYSLFVRPKGKEEGHPLFHLSEKHPHEEIFSGNASNILPIGLGVSLIGIGYEDPQVIKSVLRSTLQFSGDKEIPLWRRFVEWRKAKGDDLRVMFPEACSYLFDREDIEPGPYLHIANDAIWIARDGGLNLDEFSGKIVDRITLLSKEGRIPKAAYGRDYGWGGDRGFSYGGYAFDIEGPMAVIIEAMRKAQYGAFERIMTAEAIRLVELFGMDLNAFNQELFGENGRGGYSRTEILHLADYKVFANAIFRYVDGGYFDEVGATLDALAGRHRTPEGFKMEAAWFDQVKTALIEEANSSGPTARAQISWFLRFNWKFSAI